MTKENQNILGKALGGLVIYVLFARPLLNLIKEKLGVKDTPEKKQIDAIAQDPKSFFSVDFWRDYLYQDGATPNGRKRVDLPTFKRLQDVQQKIFNAMGVFYDDEAAIFGALSNVKTQAELSYTCFLFWSEHKETIVNMRSDNLLTYLREGKNVLPENGLNETDILKIINAATKLPKV